MFRASAISFSILAAFAVSPPVFAQDDNKSDEAVAAETTAETDVPDDETEAPIDEPTGDAGESKAAVAGGEAALMETEEVVEARADGLALENSVGRCKDGEDNDGDRYTDCDDQDCQIFAICVSSSKGAASPEAAAVKPPDTTTRRPFSIGIVPGLTTDSGAEAMVINHFTLNFIGMGDVLIGAELSMLGAIRRYDVTGFQSASLFNVNLGDSRAFQGSGSVNFNRGNFVGFQSAGLTNLTLGKVTGFQGAGIFNLSRQMAGFQGAGIGNIALGYLTGFQGAGIFNVSGGSMGFQGAGIADISLGEVKGFQGAGIGNIALGDVTGFQGAGIANVSGALVGFQGAGIANLIIGNATGLQAAGIANVTTGQLTGVQIGLINYGTKVKGAQIGLINIATEEMKGAPIGLVNYAGDGILAPTFWMSDSSMLNLGLKMGSKNVYGILGGGGHPVNKKRISIVAGIGGHMELAKDFWLELDLLHHTLHGEDDDWRDSRIDFIEQAGVNVGYRFGRQFSVYAGPSLNLLLSEEREEVGFIPAIFSAHDGDTHIALSLGLTAGIQWEPQLGRLNSRR